MDGLLIHGVKRENDLFSILDSGVLNSKNLTLVNKDFSEKEKLSFGYGGPKKIPLIFTQLMFEDKIFLPSLFDCYLFLDPKMMEDFGKQKNLSKNRYFENLPQNPYFGGFPSKKVWFNPHWMYGKYISYENYILNLKIPKTHSGFDEFRDYFSTDYDSKLPLEANIFLFNHAKRLTMINKKIPYDKTAGYRAQENEVVFYKDKIKIDKYLLGVYIRKDDTYQEAKYIYPEYNIMNEKETRKFIKDYFKN